MNKLKNKIKELIKQWACEHSVRKPIEKTMFADGKIYTRYGTECMKCGRVKWMNSRM